MKTTQDAREFCQRRFNVMRKSWLEHHDTSAWPLEFGLGIPTEKEGVADIAKVKAWVGDWKKETDTVIWTERRWRIVGTQTVPERLLLESPAAVAAWAGQSGRWNRASKRHQLLLARWPALGSAAARHFDALADYHDRDFNRVISMLSWFEQNRQSGLYHRQIPIAGLHTKWVEERRSLIADLFAAIKGETTADFYQTCGLKPAPDLVRIRILDPDLQDRFLGMGDLTVPVEDLVRAHLPVKTVFIVENLINGLSFGHRQDTVVIMARGYGLDILSRLKWLRDAQVFYWGDIDTHGLSILSRARGHVTHLQSVMMDLDTLDHHLKLDLVGIEHKPSKAELFANLTISEQALYDRLRQPDGTALRLEQEQVSWDWAMQRFSEQLN